MKMQEGNRTLIKKTTLIEIFQHKIFTRFWDILHKIDNVWSEYFFSYLIKWYKEDFIFEQLFLILFCLLKYLTTLVQIHFTSI